jgi:hypothetical protein
MEQSLLACQKDHNSCGTSELQDLPTRVIDVTTSPPRLTFGFPGKGHWIALSHCWGGAVDYILTKENIRERQKGMPLVELPPTFSDAVLVTRSLGIKYLWIDAICIIQNSLDKDWPKEASRMGEYYMNSILTISAMNAKNSREGILQKRLPRFKPLELFMHSERLPWTGSVVIRENHPKTWNFWQKAPVSALATRAWTFQETCLPARTLHFTAFGLVWECLCQTAVEWLYDPMAYGSEFKLLIRPQAIDEENARATDHSSEERNNAAYTLKQKQDYALDSWDEIIRHYSERKPTYASDKLPALSGIASRFEKMLGGDRYIAGLWKSRIRDGLCYGLI